MMKITISVSSACVLLVYLSKTLGNLISIGPGLYESNKTLEAETKDIYLLNSCQFMHDGHLYSVDFYVASTDWFMIQIWRPVKTSDLVGRMELVFQQPVKSNKTQGIYEYELNTKVESGDILGFVKLNYTFPIPYLFHPSQAADFWYHNLPLNHPLPNAGDKITFEEIGLPYQFSIIVKFKANIMYPEIHSDQIIDNKGKGTDPNGISPSSLNTVHDNKASKLNRILAKTNNATSNNEINLREQQTHKSGLGIKDKSGLVNVDEAPTQTVTSSVTTEEPSDGVLTTRSTLGTTSSAGLKNIVNFENSTSNNEEIESLNRTVAPIDTLKENTVNSSSVVGTPTSKILPLLQKDQEVSTASKPSQSNNISPNINSDDWGVKNTSLAINNTDTVDRNSHSKGKL